MPVPFADRYGLPLTSATAAAAARYGEALDRRLAAEAGVAEALAAALAADPDFALAHAALAVTARSQGRVQEGRGHAARAAALAEAAGGLTPRERGHVAAVAALAAGGAGALRTLEAHLAAFPRDALLAQEAFLLRSAGASLGGDARGERLALLERLAPHYGDDGWFLASYAFALNELGRHPQARAAAERALRARPGPAAAHTYAHVCYEAGDAAGGAAFLDRWLAGAGAGPAGPGGADGPFVVHNPWHLAVFELQLGRFGRALAVYAQRVSPAAPRGGPPALAASGAVSLLWRALLAGYPPGALPWGPARDYAARESPRAGAWRALWDAYEAAAYAGARDRGGLAGLLARLRTADAQRYPAAGPVVAPLAEGLWAFAAGDYPAAARGLGPLASHLERLGGSNEQRDAFADTLLAARLRAGEHAAAAGELRRRLARRPSALDALWLAEALTAAGAGATAETAAALRAAAQTWAGADPDFPGRAALARLAAGRGAGG